MSDRVQEVRDAGYVATKVYNDPCSVIEKLEQDIRDQNREYLGLQDYSHRQKGRIEFLKQQASETEELHKKLQQTKSSLVIDFSVRHMSDEAKIRRLTRDGEKFLALTEGLSMWCRLKFLFTGAL